MGSWSYVMSQDPVKWYKFIKGRFEEWDKSKKEYKEGDDEE